MTLASDSHPGTQPDTADPDDLNAGPGAPNEAFGAPDARTDLDLPETQALINVIERLIENFTHAVGNRDKDFYQGPAF